MSIESQIQESGQYADITVEAADGAIVMQTSIGGADRSQPWITVVQSVPCLVRPRSSKLLAYPGRNDARAAIWDSRIYFYYDPVPSGLSSRHRITVNYRGTGGWNVLGIYTVQDPVNVMMRSELFQVDCERVRVNP